MYLGISANTLLEIKFLAFSKSCYLFLSFKKSTPGVNSMQSLAPAYFSLHLDLYG
jgi:hypothetical protein